MVPVHSWQIHGSIRNAITQTRTQQQTFDCISLSKTNFTQFEYFAFRVKSLRWFYLILIQKIPQYIQNWCVNHFGRLQANYSYCLDKGLELSALEFPFLAKKHTFVREHFTSGNMDISLLWWFGIMFSVIGNKVFRVNLCIYALGVKIWQFAQHVWGQLRKIHLLNNFSINFLQLLSAC